MKNFVSFKGRPRPPTGTKVRIHRNLNLTGVWYSLTVAGQVVGHCTHVTVVNARAVINAAAQQRIADGGNREVHAWIEGELAWRDPIPGELDSWVRIAYRPRIRGQFVIDGTDWGVARFDRAAFTDKGMFAL